MADVPATRKSLERPATAWCSVSRMRYTFTVIISIIKRGPGDAPMNQGQAEGSYGQVTFNRDPLVVSKHAIVALIAPFLCLLCPHIAACDNPAPALAPSFALLLATMGWICDKVQAFSTSPVSQMNQHLGIRRRMDTQLLPTLS